MTSDQIRTIEDVCLRVTSGGTPSRRVPDYFNGTIPWLKTQEIRDKRIYETEEHISQKAVDNSSAKLLPADTVMMAMYGATVGKLAILGTEMTCNQAACAMIVNPEAADYRYLYYTLLNDRNRIVDRANGAAQQNLSARTIKSLDYRFPAIEEQRAIAATLGALDDKIESNRGAVEIIQLTVRAIFVQWRSETDAIETSTFGKYADVYGGATPKTAIAEYWGGDLEWTTPTDVTGLSAPYLFGTSRKITDRGLTSSTAVMHPVGTIFMTSRATIGAFAINQVPAATNQGFIVVRPKQDADRFFLFEEMRARVDEFRDNANGSTFLEISRGRFKELPLKVPEAEDIAQLNERLYPLHFKAAQLVSESERLAALRDALLPELLAGRVTATQGFVA